MEQYDAMLASMQKERYVDQQLIFAQGSKPEALKSLTLTLALTPTLALALTLTLTRSA